MFLREFYRGNTLIDPSKNEWSAPEESHKSSLRRFGFIK